MSNSEIYHITDVSNLPSILGAGGLHSDSTLQTNGVQPTVIGYSHIKQRRMSEIRVACSANRFVGEFVPFYFCPRSPMLYTINRGSTGRVPGCQTEIIHLVSNVNIALNSNLNWAYSNGNAGSYITDFFNDVEFSQLDWGIINSNNWGGEFRRDKKSSEFLVHNFYPWESISHIGCYNEQTKLIVERLINDSKHRPVVNVRNNWYY